MKKIVHIVLFENYQEGYSYQENLLTQKQKELGYDVYIIASQRYRDNNYRYHLRDTGFYINEYGIPVRVLPCTKYNPHIARFFDECIGLYEALVEITPDIIFLHNFSGKDVRHLRRYLKTHYGVVLYVDSHADFYNKPINTIKDKIGALEIGILGRSLIPFAKMFWGTLPWRVQYLREVYKIPSNKTDLLIMGADEGIILGKDREKVKESIRGKYKIPDNAFLISSGGKLDKRKQQNLLMEAVRQMSNSIYLIIFGEPTEEMKPVFEEYGKDNNIILPGWLPSEQAYDIFMASDLAFFPGTHSVLWEQAVACETPIVTKHWEGMEHIDCDGNAILMDNVDVDHIKDVIIRLQDTSVYSSMKKRAVEVAHNFYLKEIALKAIGEL